MLNVICQVIGMLEKRVGEEPFKKLLERMVTAACEDSGKGEVHMARTPAKARRSLR